MTSKRLSDEELAHMERVAQEMLPVPRRLTLAMVAEIRTRRAAAETAAELEARARRAEGEVEKLKKLRDVAWNERDLDDDHRNKDRS